MRKEFQKLEVLGAALGSEFKLTPADPAIDEATIIMPDLVENAMDVKIPENIILAKNENVFNLPTIRKIREWSHNKSVVVVDAHGVLIHRNTDKVYKHAIEVVQAIHRKGYALALWTYGGDEVRRIFSQKPWSELFGLMIFKDNYVETSENILKSFVESTPQTPVRYKEKPRYLTNRKNPDLFGGYTVVIDDDLQTHYPSHLLSSNNHGFIQVVPTDAGLLEYGGRILKGDLVFNEAIVLAIDTLFAKSKTVNDHL